MTIEEFAQWEINRLDPGDFVRVKARSAGPMPTLPIYWNSYTYIRANGWLFYAGHK